MGLDSQGQARFERRTGGKCGGLRVESPAVVAVQVSSQPRPRMNRNQASRDTLSALLCLLLTALCVQTCESPRPASLSLPLSCDE